MTESLPGSFTRNLRRATEAARSLKLWSVGLFQNALPKLDLAAGATRHIAIIGAGLSGLCAGYLLAEAGLEVTVLEARKQPGGRTLTLRDAFFPDGIHADAGAARISDVHARTLAWIRHFGLALDPMYPDAGHLIGERDGHPVLGADAARLSAHDIHHILTSHLHWDAQRAASRSARVLARNSFVKPNWYRIRDGMDSLARAFADRLTGAIRYGAPVTAIRQDATGVGIRFRTSGGEQWLRADFVVSAVPYTTLKAIEVSPPFPDDKRRIIDRGRCESATRVFLQLRDRAWLPPRWSGFGVTGDRWEIWHSSFASTERCVLAVYAQGEAAVPFAALTGAARIARVKERLEKLFPGILASCESTAEICWDENPWSLGAQQVGELPRGLVTRVEGRVHFAGAHTSETGWMEGALESGYRVAAEILPKVQDSTWHDAVAPEGLRL